MYGNNIHAHTNKHKTKQKISHEQSINTKLVVMEIGKLV